MPVPDDRMQALSPDEPPREHSPTAAALHLLHGSTDNLTPPTANGHQSALPSPTFPRSAIPVPTAPHNANAAAPAEYFGNKEYGFLIGHLIDEQALTHASLLAWSSGTDPHNELISQGWIGAADYTFAVAAHLGLAVWSGRPYASAAIHALSTVKSKAGCLRALRFTQGAKACLTIDATGQTPRELARFVQANAALVDQVFLATRSDLLAMLERSKRAAFLSFAINGLRWSRPDLSAGVGVWLWQAVLLSLLVGVAVGALAVASWPSISVLTGLAVVPFFCVVILRCTALGEVMAINRAGRQAAAHKARANAELPVYTILVPLFRETPVLAQLLRALAALDYPAVKLQILLVLEASDIETIAAVEATKLAANIDVIVVPDAHPHTKPKAVNYALQFAHGTYTVIYDAEDIPEPDQLRRAVAAFDQASPQLACLQARLNLYNPYAGWFARQFTIEYSALFDALLPALQRLGLPIPLGGTSNHFRTDVLRRVGAWDPYNVTEDADLGIRLARLGWQVAILHSTTFEEAPTRFTSWLKQRTRWLKGWMQTYLVHTRRPRALYRDLGFLRFCGLHVLMGGLLLSALVHPLFYILLAASAWSGTLMADPASLLAYWLLVVASLNLVVGYLSAILVGVAAVLKRGHFRLVLSALSMPIYWLFISAAAYRALYQLIRTPYLWEKTDHKGF